MALPELQTVIDNGPSANRIDIVVLGEGYTAADISAGTLDADVSDLTQYLFNGSPLSEPFGRYASFFNVHVVEIASNQSGADHPSSGVTVDTALDATYGSAGIERCLP